MINLNLPPQTLQKLQQQINPQNPNYQFLGFTANLQTGTLTDNLNQTSFEAFSIKVIPVLLDHYTQGKPTPPTGKLIKYKDIPGGHAYEGAFIHRAIEPIVEVFGETPEKLFKSSELLDGKPQKHGNASFVVEALKGIPLTYILWIADEFPAQVNILYDESASNYLPTEDLAVLGELVTIRLLQARQLIK
jgi:hypothetical protein